MHRSTLFLTLVAILLIVAGCSGSSSNPVTPPGSTNWSADFQSATSGTLPNINNEPDSRELCGIYTTEINIEELTATVLPNRNTNYHVSVLPYIEPPIIYVKSWDPVTETVDVDVSIRNTSPYTAYDVRLIIFTDDAGHRLLNPDNYTHLWDIPQGEFYNGFKAYAKENTNRVLNSMELKTENVHIKCPNSNFLVQFAVDASWPSNCEEPYEISNFTQGTLHDHEGGSAQLHVDALDWQDDVNMVLIQCAAITGEEYTFFAHDTGNTWTLDIVNNVGALAGEYIGLIAATSLNSPGIYLLDEVTITVTETTDGGWARTWGGVGNDEAQDVAVDDEGNIYATGLFQATVDFNPDLNEADIHISNDEGDAFITKFDKYGDFKWARSWDGTSGISLEWGYAVDTDSLGNVYVGGDFYHDSDFDPGPGEDLKITNGLSDCFLSKYTSNGDYLWTLTWGGTSWDHVQRISIDNQNNIHLTGYFQNSVDFDPDPVAEEWHSSNRYSDVYITKFDYEGNHLFARIWNGADYYDQGLGIAVDESGNIYCSGYFEYASDFTHDAFLIKYNSSGNLEWDHIWGSIDDDEAWECAVDEFGDVYVTGSFYWTVDFNPDPLETEEKTAVWESDCFVSNFSQDGDFQWVLVWGSTSYDVGLVIETDHNGHFWAGGEASGETDFDPGPGSDVKKGGWYLSKFNINGNYEWSSLWMFLDYSLDIDSYGNSYLCGWYSNSTNTDFDPGQNIERHNSNGGWDSFLVKNLSNGLWE